MRNEISRLVFDLYPFQLAEFYSLSFFLRPWIISKTSHHSLSLSIFFFYPLFFFHEHDKREFVPGVGFKSDRL